MEQALTRLSRPNPGPAAPRTPRQSLGIDGGSGSPFTGNPFAARQAPPSQAPPGQGAAKQSAAKQSAASPVATAASASLLGGTNAYSVSAAAANADSSRSAAVGASSGSPSAFDGEDDQLQDELPGRSPQRRTATRESLSLGPSSSGGDPLLEGLSLLAGVSIGLLTLVVPLLSVISDRGAGIGLLPEPAALSGRRR